MTSPTPLDMPKDREAAIYALAASWASIDGKMEAFGKERFAQSREDATTGHHEGYLIEAEEMLARLEKRGFTIVPTPLDRV